MKMQEKRIKVKVTEKKTITSAVKTAIVRQHWGDLIVFSFFLFFVLLTDIASAETCSDGTTYCCNACHTEKTCGHGACDSCHGNPPTKNVVDQNDKGGLLWYPLATGSTSAGAHLKHATLSGMNYACDECHKDGMQIPPMRSDFKIQVGFNGNGNKNYDGRTIFNAPYDYAGTNNTGITRGGTLVCSNTYCHSNGTGGTANVNANGVPPLNDTRPVSNNASPAWNTASVPLPCNSCHGNTAYTDYRMAAPIYSQDQPKANSHSIHQGFTCDACHFETTADGLQIKNPSKHANRIYDVVPNTTKSFTGVGITDIVPAFHYRYDNGGGNCSDISCHVARGLGSGAYIWGGSSMSVSSAWRSTSNCFEMQFYNVSVSGGTAPYTFFWDFGDSTTSAEQNPTHMFPSGSSYAVTLTARDAYNHTATRTSSVTPQSVNISPVVNAAVSVQGYTVTLTDLSYDPDYNTCGHSGSGQIKVQWNDAYNNSPITTEMVNLTGSPSNRIFTYTYSSKYIPHNQNIYLSVTDNTGAKVTKVIGANVPSTYQVGGQITKNGVGVAGVYVYLWTAGGTALSYGTSPIRTDANGYYSFSGMAVDGNCYSVHTYNYPYTFTPSSQTVCSASSTVNFTALP